MTHTSSHRRLWLKASAAGAAALAVGRAGASEIPSRRDSFRPLAAASPGQGWLRKLIYAAADAQVTWLMTGTKYAQTGSRLQPLWRTYAVAFHDVVLNGPDLLLRSVEIPFSLDLASDRQLTHWTNPLSGDRVAVPMFPPTPVRKHHRLFEPHRREVRPGLVIEERYSEPALIGPTLWFRGEKRVDLKGTNGTAGFQGLETLHYSAAAADLKAAGVRHVAANLTLNIVSTWLPWMKLAGRDGGLLTLASGSKLEPAAPLPGLTRRLLARHYAEVADDPFSYLRQADAAG